MQLVNNAMETAALVAHLSNVRVRLASRESRESHLAFNRERQSTKVRLPRVHLALWALKGHRRADYTNAGQSRWEVNREAAGGRAVPLPL